MGNLLDDLSRLFNPVIFLNVSSFFMSVIVVSVSNAVFVRLVFGFKSLVSLVSHSIFSNLTLFSSVLSDFGSSCRFSSRNSCFLPSFESCFSLCHLDNSSFSLGFHGSSFDESGMSAGPLSGDTSLFEELQLD